MLSYQKLKKNPVRFLAATSLTVEEFENLLPAFEAAYEKKYPREKTLEGQSRQRSAGGGAKVPFRQTFLTMDSMSIFIVKHICRRDTGGGKNDIDATVTDENGLTIRLFFFY